MAKKRWTLLMDVPLDIEEICKLWQYGLERFLPKNQHTPGLTYSKEIIEF